MQDMLKFLKEHDHYIILTHSLPDGDALGSAAGLCLGLRRLGKTAYVGCNPDITPMYRPFVQDFLAPTSYKHDTVVAVDTAGRKLIPECWRAWAVGAKIDHHPLASESDYADVSYIDPGAAACGEVIMLILESLGIVIDAEIAGPLYLAITTDTGCFRYSSTTARTHRMAAQLFDTGLPAGEIDDLVFSQKSRVRMQMESAALQSIEYFAQGKVAMVLILWNAIHEAGANEDDLENISALPRQVAGVDIGLTLRQEENGCKISVRTSPPYEANLICARLGGGGHARAGGCRLAERDLEAVRVMLLDSVYTCYPELGTI